MWLLCLPGNSYSKVKGDLGLSLGEQTVSLSTVVVI